MKKDSIDMIVENFDVSQFVVEHGTGRGGPITVWLPNEHKAKYDELQSTSGRKFGKLLKEVLKRTIDQVHSTEKAG